MIDLNSQRAVDWQVESLQYGEGFLIELRRWPRQDASVTAHDAEATISVADLQSFAFVDSALLSHYWNDDDSPPLLQEAAYDGVSTHIGDHRIFEDHRKSGYSLWRVTTGEETLEILCRNGSKPVFDGRTV